MYIPGPLVDAGGLEGKLDAYVVTLSIFHAKAKKKKIFLKAKKRIKVHKSLS